MNRVKYLLNDRGFKMQEKINEIHEEKIDDREDFKRIIEEVKEGVGYTMGITIIDKDRKLRHYLIADNFPKLDLLKSWAEIKRLIIEDLEK